MSVQYAPLVGRRITMVNIYSRRAAIRDDRNRGTSKVFVPLSQSSEVGLGSRQQDLIVASYAVVLRFDLRIFRRTLYTCTETGMRVLKVCDYKT